MGKSYTDQLEDWVKHRAKTRRDRNIVAFLAAASDIRAALTAGYAAKTVWANLYESGRIPFCYDTFLSYLRRNAPDLPEAPRQVQTASPAAPESSAHQPGFHFNPVPKKEELL